MAGPAPADTFVSGPPPAQYTTRRGRRSWPWILAALLVAVLAAGAIWLAQEGAKSPVPGVVGTPVNQAQSLLDQRGFDVNVDRQPSLQPVDQVIAQDPGAGSKAKKGSTVTLTVSDGPPNRVVPAVEGLPLKVALRKLETAGFRFEVEQQSSDTVNKGLVISTSPGGGTLDQQGDRIRVNVSSGIAKFALADLTGLDQDTAESQLNDKGLVPVVVQQESDQPEKTVISQDPVAGTKVAAGDRVTITVSKGPSTVAVPDTVGLTEGDARGELQSAGFKVQARQRAVDNQSDDGLVVDQRPGHGTQLKKGRTVVIWVGKFTAPAPTPAPPTTPSPVPPATGLAPND